MTDYIKAEIQQLGYDIDILLTVGGDESVKIKSIGTILQFILDNKEIPADFLEHYQYLVEFLTSGDAEYVPTTCGFDISVTDKENLPIFDTEISITERESDREVDIYFETLKKDLSNKLTFIITVGRDSISFRQYN